MSVKVKKKGEFEVFETTHHHKILVLDEKEYYAWIDTALGHLLVKSDGDHKKEKTLLHDKYLLILPKNEPKMKDNIDHLELKEGQSYHTYILPNGLPDENDEQKKIVETEDFIPEDDIKDLVE